MFFLLPVGLLMMFFGGWVFYWFIKEFRAEDRTSKLLTIIFEFISSDVLFGLGTFGLGLLLVLIWYWNVRT